ncbi:hypothetical protein HWV62_9972 [Athelia sp. TMB]|nr:hypothetical protein HWV62_44933 [Athelia sp. TMB]KAF7984995.1 hypothetical protein HWV62_9972 [Athelia sp. TMB]
MLIVIQQEPWKGKEQGVEARYIRDKEQTQLAAVRDQMKKDVVDTVKEDTGRDIEGGFGGQEDLEDRYATTSGEH